MAYRGRGGVRGGYGHARYVTNKPFVPFPDIHLPDARGILSDLDQKKNKGLNEEETLIKETLNWLMKSEYNLDQTDKQGKDVEISERTKQKAKRKIDSFSQYLVPSMFPKELTRGSNVRQLSREKVQWDRGIVRLNAMFFFFGILINLDNVTLIEKKAEIDWTQFEKLEQNQDAKKKKEGEKDEEEEEDNEEDEEEDGDSITDDYDKPEDFDDDEDDYNPEDDGADEPLLD